MAIFSTPGVRTTEIDNSIRTITTPSVGVGAMVMKANRGPVNQRILTSSYNHFTEVFGEPEELTDYGHFAAENYLARSNALYAVRATMGDEQYAQIQYPYSDASKDDTYTSDDNQSFRYINNEDDSQLDVLDQLDGADPVVDMQSLTAGNEYLIDGDTSAKHFYAKQRGQFVTINDLITDAAESVAVFKTVGDKNAEMTSLASVTDGSGTYIEFAQNVARNGDITKKYDDLIITNEAWTAKNDLPANMFSVPTTGYSVTSNSGVTGYKVSFQIPATDTLNGQAVACTAWLTDTTVSAITAGSATYQTIFADDSFYKGANSATTGYCVTADALKLQFKDWDDLNTKTYYVKADETTGTVGQAVGIAYREYGFADNAEALVMNDEDGVYGITCVKVPTLAKTEEGKKLVTNLATEYGIELADINSDGYAVLSYVSVWDGKLPNDEDVETDAAEKRVYKIIYVDKDSNTSNYFSLDDETGKFLNQYLFWVYSKHNSGKTTSVACYTAETPDNIVVPWQDGLQKQDTEVANASKKGPVNKMIAYPTSEILNSVNGTYRDGYTLSMQSDEEPGNGDIEQYQSNKENQLIIGAIGPGKYGNDIGISIITPECADIAALNHQNAFMWKYRYDDEDLVNKDDPNTDFTWKKVYRINVYVKTSTQTADAAWGTGLDALTKDPTEWFLVSNDPQAKDGEGNSLYAPNVINGVSEYIYVSRSSVTNAMTGAGEYAMPKQTYAIYGLTGGANSKKNNISEKTAALKLYSDRQKCDFDILFNNEAIDTFNGKQRYAAHQRRIAEIAAARTMDIGVVQLTSKEAKTIKRQLSEAKAFQFNNGSYIAAYAGYDKYYNTELASWIYLPKSVAAACAMAYCDVAYAPWYAPAGTKRGSIDYSASQLTRLTDDEIGQLYDANVNTSRACGAMGEVLYGQKTALKKESSLNRINVRRCMNYCEKYIETMMYGYLFEQNIESTRASMKNSLDSFLSRVKAGGGIVEYATSVTENDQDTHVVDVNCTIKPAEAIEFIDVKITITRDTVTVSEDNA